MKLVEGGIDAALKTLLEVVDNHEDMKDEVTPEVTRKLSTESIQLPQYPQAKVRRIKAGEEGIEVRITYYSGTLHY